ncbi:MAG: hypothetical protein JRJ24_10870 [Deltaproteobacteria bacterium]|nr:hypothetical protein [Deltaproteobacteria bacterium]
MARRWYDDQRFGLGLVFFDAFEAAVERALRFPDAGIAVLDEKLRRPVRRFPVSGFPFYVVTTVLDDGLVVVARVGFGVSALTRLTTKRQDAR